MITFSAQNPLWRPRVFVCISTKKRMFCYTLNKYFSMQNNELRIYSTQHGVLGVECSNHSVPTIIPEYNQTVKPIRWIGFFVPARNYTVVS
jgi:hypothetical protein